MSVDTSSTVTLEYSLTRSYSPVIPIQIMTASGHPMKQSAILDIGFTGFLHIPLTTGIGCNLRLWGTCESRLADGRVVDNLECLGEIKIEGQILSGVITLSSTGSDCLLGMSFLEKLNGSFTVSNREQKAVLIFERKNQVF